MKKHNWIGSWSGEVREKECLVLSFRKVDEEFGWLSNMSAHRLKVEDVWYHTCEHYFQCLRFDDRIVRGEIGSVKSPMRAKMVAKKYKEKMVVVPRSEEDLEAMRQVIRFKVQMHPNLQRELVGQNPDSVIIEDCTHRGGESAKFWGMIKSGDVWVGQNWLGRLWMDLRSELQL
jgi:hypothetical protein